MAPYHLLAPYLKKIDETQIYSNFGPLHNELKLKLAEYFKCKSENIALASSATSGLTGVIELTTARENKVSVPSWTFAATGHAVDRAGRDLNITDISKNGLNLETWREGVFPNAEDRKVAVAPFGQFGEKMMSCLSDESVLVVDAASCFDSLAGIGEGIEIEQINPIVVSTHATKGFATGEGGIIIGPQSLIEEFRIWSNFGFDGSREASHAGTNAKMSEYHAAIGLANLENWRRTRDSLKSTFELYYQAIGGSGFGLEHPETWGCTPTLVIDVDPDLKENLKHALKANEVPFRDWWGSGLHQMQAFVDRLEINYFPLSEELAKSTIGVPFGLGFEEREIEVITSILLNLKN